MLADSYADVTGLLERCRHLEMKLSSLSRPPTHSTTGIDLVKGDDKAACFYTGFRSFLLFMACFNFLEPAAKVSLLPFFHSFSCPLFTEDSAVTYI